jgi:hypothetical protein
MKSLFARSSLGHQLGDKLVFKNGEMLPLRITLMVKLLLKKKSQCMKELKKGAYRQEGVLGRREGYPGLQGRRRRTSGLLG